MGQTATHRPGYRTAPQTHAGAANWQAPVPQGVSSVQGLGFGVLICFLFMIFSRVW
jgi:hypothetical protein